MLLVGLLSLGGPSRVSASYALNLSGIGAFHKCCICIALLLHTSAHTAASQRLVHLCGFFSVQVPVQTYTAGLLSLGTVSRGPISFFLSV